MPYIWCYMIGVVNMSLFVLDFANGMDVDVGLQDTLNPCHGRSRSIEMDVEIDVGTNARVDGNNGLVVPSIKLCSFFKIFHMTCQSIDFMQSRLLHSATQHYLNLLHLVSLFLFPLMYPKTFFSKSPLGTLILDIPPCLPHTHLSTL